MHEPGTGYDAIVVGAGRRGLAIANDLAERHGLTDVAVLDRRAELNEVGWAHAAVEVIPDCEVTEILSHRGRVVGVDTTRGCIEAPRVVMATAAAVAH